MLVAITTTKIKKNEAFLNDYIYPKFNSILFKIMKKLLK